MTGTTKITRRVRCGMRFGGAVMVVVASLLPVSVVDASAGSTSAERSAAEIQAARDRADAAAQALFDTEADIDRFEIEVAETQKRLNELEVEASGMRAGLEQQAVRSFVGAGGPTMPLLIDIDQANDVLAAGVFTSIASENLYVNLDDFDAAMVEVNQTRDAFEAQQIEAAAATERFATLIIQAEQEVVYLGEVEAQRLEDEAVRAALEAQQRSRAEQERKEGEAAQAGAAARAATSASGNSAATTAPARAPVAAQQAPQGAGSSLVCPVAGPRAFADTWGAARSGGRRHQGVDIISPSGTPLVAMESGRIEFKSNRLGGQTVRLYGGSGTRYYYAHLSGYAGGNRSVNRGDVIGYVGRTGNTTTNHLHLQIHPGGGQPVNPYSYARNACG
jgi:murein DD-endopeptidase MepM/ murein hydrolase activator NlpD